MLNDHVRQRHRRILHEASLSPVVQVQIRQEEDSRDEDCTERLSLNLQWDSSLPS
jgi:hypothetical protein